MGMIKLHRKWLGMVTMEKSELSDIEEVDEKLEELTCLSSMEVMGQCGKLLGYCWDDVGMDGKFWVMWRNA